MDLHAAVPESCVISPNSICLVPTGFAIAIPPGYEGQVRPRSGLSVRHGITIINSPATIDSDYRGEIQVPLLNLGSTAFEVTRGLRIAQLVISQIPRITWVEQPELTRTERHDRGFGHTDD